MLEVASFRPEFTADASALFVRNLTEQRRHTPALPATMANEPLVAERLGRLMASCGGICATDAGQLVGFMGWYEIDRFRDANRKAAYCPEWGHGAADGREGEVYRAMYRAASSAWVATGCQMHAITLLAHDRAAEQVWYWNGFGLAVVDGVRPMRPLDIAPRTDLLVRKATQADAPALAELDAEHNRHYGQPPIFMQPSAAPDAQAQACYLEQPNNSVWLGVDGRRLAGLMRFNGNGHGGAAVLQGTGLVGIAGAYVRPQYRGRGAASEMLDAALRDYATRGYTCCGVDFESFNPEAAGFWPRYFEPVCVSMFRVPETMGASQPPEGGA